MQREDLERPIECATEALALLTATQSLEGAELDHVVSVIQELKQRLRALQALLSQ